MNGLTSYNYADAPAADVNTGIPVAFADFGNCAHTSVFISNGVEYFPMGGSALLHENTAITSLEYAVPSQELVTYDIPADLIVSTGSIKVALTLSATLGSVTKLDLDVTFDGEQAIHLLEHLDGAALCEVTVHANGTYSYCVHRADGNVAVGTGTHTLDFTAAIPIVVSATLKHADDVLAAPYFGVTLIK